MEMIEEREEFRDLKGVFRRRRKSFLVTFLLILAAGVTVAFLLPPIYKSQCTILIEEQQIPPEYVKTTVTSYVEERLQMITQQIMSRTNLLEIINRFGLYRDLRDRYTTEEIIEQMRDDIHLETISADVIDKRSGRQSPATIAFTLSYEGKDPGAVQRVTNTLASLYLEENLKTREQRASNTTSFFEQELEELKGRIDELENKITKFKRAHIGELPEYNAINMQAVSRLNRDLDNLDMQLRSLKERKIYLEGQIAGVDPLTPVVTEEGKTIMNPKERLKFLRLQLVSFRASLSEKHPDIRKLKKEISELEAQVGDTEDQTAKLRRLEDVRGKLAQLKGKLGDKHPDVVRLAREEAALEAEVAASKSVTRASKEEAKPDNPAYINLKTQIASAEMEIKSLLEEKARIRKELRALERKIARAPLVEKQYNALTRDYEMAKQRYNEIANKLMEARVAQGMEETQRGERFTIIDPAQFPEKPDKPNRLAIILIGFVLALGAGVGMAAGRESLDQTIKSPEELAALSGAPVLSVISLTETARERRARLAKRILLLLLVLGLIAACLALVNAFMMPLDILWIKVQRRIALGMGI